METQASNSLGIINENKIKSLFTNATLYGFVMNLLMILPIKYNNNKI